MRELNRTRVWAVLRYCDEPRGATLEVQQAAHEVYDSTTCEEFDSSGFDISRDLDVWNHLDARGVGSSAGGNSFTGCGSKRDRLPAGAASAVAALRASWPEALSSAAAACPPVAAVRPAAAPSPVATATPVPPLISPAVTGPLAWQSPTAIDLSKMLGLNEIAPPVSDLFKFDINGVVSGIGIVENHAVSGDRSARADASNAQVIIQKPDGLIQYYLEVGAYSIPELGAAYVSSGNAVNRLWGPLPEGYLRSRLQPIFLF
jgi:hypothetical protein